MRDAGVKGNMSTKQLMEACRDNRHLNHLLVEACALNEKRKGIAKEQKGIRFLLKTLGPDEVQKHEQYTAMDATYSEQLKVEETKRKDFQFRLSASPPLSPKIDVVVSSARRSEATSPRLHWVSTSEPKKALSGYPRRWP